MYASFRLFNVFLEVPFLFLIRNKHYTWLKIHFLFFYIPQSGRRPFLCHQIGTHRPWTSKQCPPTERKNVCISFFYIHSNCDLFPFDNCSNLCCEFNHSPVAGETNLSVVADDEPHTEGKSKEKTGMHLLFVFFFYYICFFCTGQSSTLPLFCTCFHICKTNNLQFCYICYMLNNQISNVGWSLMFIHHEKFEF